MARIPAVLELLDPPPKGPNAKPSPTGKRIELTFNPKEVTIQKAAQYDSKHSKKDTNPAYLGADPGTLTLEVFLDHEFTKNVVADVKAMLECVQPVTKGATTNPTPPWVRFVWGGGYYFEYAVVKSVSVKYTLFDSQGLPVRAVCTLSLQEAKRSTAKQNPTSGALMPVRTHRVIAGDTLAGIAYAEYGRPTVWRAIAVANRIDDPMRLRPGATLMLPSPDDVDALDRGGLQ
ncbi:MAG: peptidase [Acidimicrobiia bacterium]|nr:peptidase [Acidimicrobiia bacterium]